MSISTAVAAQTSMVQHMMSLHAIKLEAKNAQSIVSLLAKSQQDLAATTETRGQNLNISI